MGNPGLTMILAGPRAGTCRGPGCPAETYKKSPDFTSRIPYIRVAYCSVAVPKGKSSFKRQATSAGGVISVGSAASRLRLKMDDGSDGDESRRLIDTDRRAAETPWPLTSRMYNPTFPLPNKTMFNPSP